MQDPDISVVLPVYNEENSIGVLIAEIRGVFDTMVKKTYEIIVVDDASVDRSVAIAESAGQTLRNNSPLLLNFSVIKERMRSGQFHELLQGMRSARGALVVTMDSDLQHDPADIPDLLSALGTNDLVCGIRADRHDGAARRYCSKTANSFRNLITGDTTTDSGCMFRIMRRECVAAVLPWDGRLFGCEALFFPLLIRKKGFRAVETQVSHRQRIFGKSRYHLIRGRLFSGLAACIRIALTK
jgi:dolichol-phosphate mannosyltransferase